MSNKNKLRHEGPTRLTFHARIKMEARGISRSAVMETIANPFVRRVARNGCRSVTAPQLCGHRIFWLVVIVGPDPRGGEQVVTAYPLEASPPAA